MTENILDIARRVRELSGAATPEPWAAFDATRGNPADGPTQFDIRNENELVAVVPDYSRGGYDDATFIAETRTAALQLAEAFERMAAWLRECGAWGSRDAAFDARELLRELGIPLEEAGDD